MICVLSELTKIEVHTAGEAIFDPPLRSYFDSKIIPHGASFWVPKG